jgi:hypothetical protein
MSSDGQMFHGGIDSSNLTSSYSDGKNSDTVGNMAV